jgi:hypothetical protein
MAETIDILIKIREVGRKAVDDLVASLRELRNQVNSTQANKFNEISKNVEEIGGTVERVADKIDDTVAHVAAQTKDYADDTISRIESRAQSATETFYTRSIVAFGALGIAGSSAVEGVFSVFLGNFSQAKASATSALASFTASGSKIGPQIAASFSSSLGSVKGAFVSLTTGLDDFFLAFQKISAAPTLLSSITASATGLLGVLGGVSGVVKGLAVAGGQFMFFSIFLGEATVLFRRLVGLGSESLTPLERGTRSLTTVDEAIHGIGLTTGQLFKTVAFGIATFTGPFAGILAGIPFVNSLITSMLRFGERGRLSLYAFFGSARSQFSLIMFDVKTLLGTVVPAANILLGKGTGLQRLALGFGNFFGSKRATALTQIIELKDAILKALPAIIDAINKFSNSYQQAKVQIKPTDFPLSKIFGIMARDIGNDVKKIATSFATLGKGAFAGLASAGRFFVGIFKKEKQPDISGQIEQLLSFEQIKSRTSQFPGKVRPYLQSLIRSAFDVSLLKEYKPEHLAKVFETFLKAAFAFKGQVEIPRDLVNRVSTSFSKAIAAGAQAGVGPGKDLGATFLKSLTSSLQKDAPAELRKAVSSALQGLQSVLFQATGTKGKGQAIAKDLAAGFAAGAPQLKTATEAMLKPVEDQFPGSLPKYGPLLKALTKTFLIPQYVAKGMLSGIGATQKAAGTIAESIAGYFPRSLPLVGPLISLVSMGVKIPYYLAQGIGSGAKLVITTIANLVESMVSHLREVVAPVAELEHLANRLGVSVTQLSALDYAMKTVGGSASDLEFVFSRLGEKVARGFNDDELIKIRRLGVDLEKVSRSANPATEMLLQLSDVLQQAGPDTDVFRDALEILGVTAGSKVVNVLRKGSDEIQRLQQEAVEAGAVIPEAFAKTSVEFTSLLNKFEMLRENAKRLFVAEVLPQITQKLQDLFSFIKANGAQIHAVIKIGGQALGVLLEITQEFFRVLVTDPEKVWKIIKTTVTSSVDFVWNTLSEFFENTGGSVLDFFIVVGGKILKAVSKIAGLAFREILKVGKAELPGIISSLGKILAESVSSVGQTESERAAVLHAEAYAEKWALKRDLGKEATKNLVPQLNKIKAEIKAVREEIFDAEWDIKEGLTSADPSKLEALKSKLDELAESYSKVDIEIGKIQDNISKKVDTGEITEASSILSGIFTKQDIDEISVSWNKLWKSVASKESAEQVAKNFEKLKQELSASASGTELPNLLGKMADIFTKEGYDATLKAAQEFQTTLASEIESGKPKIEKASESVGEVISNGIMKSLNNLPQLIADKTREIAIILAKMREQVGEGTSGEVARLESQKSQEAEREQFKKHLEEKRSLEGFYQMEADERSRYFEKEKADRIEFDALQGKNTVMQAEKEKREGIIKTFETIGSVSTNISTMFDDLYEMSKNSVKEFFYASKAAAVAQTVMNTAAGVMKAMAEPGGIAGLALAATVAAMGTVQVAKIVGQTLGYQAGGLTPGADTGRDDRLVAVGGKEFIQPASAVDYYGVNLMEMLRRKLLPRDYFDNLNRNLAPLVPGQHFIEGGLVGQQAPTQAHEQQPIIINNTNILDPGLIARYLSSQAGKHAQLNFMSDNAVQIRAILAR